MWMKILIPVTIIILLLGCSSPTHRIHPLQETAAGVLIEDATDANAWIEYGRTCILTNNYPGAIESFRMALKIDDHNMRAYEHLALAFYALGEIGISRQVCEEGLKKDLKFSPLWLRSGYCLLEEGELGRALEALEKAQELSKDVEGLVSALLGMAIVYDRQCNHEKALDALCQAAILNPEVLEMLADLISES